MKKQFTLLLFVLLAFSWRIEAQFSESFEGNFPPNDWTVINDGDSEGWEDDSDEAHSGDQSVSIYSSLDAHDDWLITPAITVTSGLTDRLTLWAKNDDEDYRDEFNVKLSTTGVNKTDFTVDLALNLAPGEAWEKFEYDLSAYIGQTVYIAIQAISTDQYALYIDDVTNDALPPCSGAITPPWKESFEDPFDFSCWENTGDSYAWEVNDGSANGPGNIKDGSQAIMFNVVETDRGDTATATTPVFDMTSLSSPLLSFDYWMNGPADNDLWLKVEISTDNGTNWTEIFKQVQDGSISDWKTINLTLSGTTNTTLLRFVASSDFGGYNIFLDNLIIEEKPSCMMPENLIVENITSNSADLSWIDNTSGNASYIVEWKELNSSNWETATTSAGATSYQITDLNPNTKYEWKVTADCGGGDTSRSITGSNFITDCGILIPDYIEDFSDMNFYSAPNCWEEGTGPETAPTSLGSSTWTNDGFLNNGDTGAAKIYLVSNSKQDWLISPHFNLSGNLYKVNFQVGITKAKNTDASAMGSDDQVKFLISTDAGTTWNTLETWDTSNTPTNTGEEIEINLDQYTEADVRFAFWASDGSTDDTEDYNFYVDNFTITTVACPIPSTLLVNNITENSATFTWEDNSSNFASYTIEWREKGTTDWQSTVVEAGNNSYQITNLNPNTEYEWQITANCGDNNNSNTIQGENFTTINSSNIDTLSKYNFTFYPNPTNNQLNISAKKNIKSIQIYNMLGQEILNAQINKEKYLINTSELNVGTYFIKVNIDNNYNYYRFIKQ